MRPAYSGEGFALPTRSCASRDAEPFDDFFLATLRWGLVRVGMRYSLVVSVAIAVLLQTACGSSEGQDSSETRVRTYVLSSTPEVSIGSVTGDEPYLLHNVSDATLQSDGSIVIVHCGGADVRYFGCDGTHLRTVGRRGQGPGEFQIPQRVFRLGGDTLAVTELLGGRVTTLGPDGTVEGTAPVGAQVRGAAIIGRLDNGVFVARRSDRDTTIAPVTAYRRTASLLLLDESGAVLDSAVGLPAWDAMTSSRERGPTLGLRLSRAAVFAVDGSGIYYGGQDSTGITKYGASLEPTTEVSPITVAEPVTDEVRAAFDAMEADRAHMPPDGIIGSTVDAYPEYMPAFRDIVAGRDGRLWVEDPERPGVHPLTWTAYEDGAAVARVELPPRFFAFEFGPDWVLGATYDEMTVERIQLRRFVEAPLPGVQLPPRDAMPPGQPRCGAWASR